MAGKKSKAASAKPDAEAQQAKEPADRPVKIDEYIDDKYDVRELDALDVPYALRSESVLDEVADEHDGIEEVDVLASTHEETVDTGVRRNVRDEDANMGLGAEVHSAEDMEDAAIGDALPGRRGVTRDNQLHGSAFLDDEHRAADDLR